MVLFSADSRIHFWFSSLHFRFLFPPSLEPVFVQTPEVDVVGGFEVGSQVVLAADLFARGPAVAEVVVAVLQGVGGLAALVVEVFPAGIEGGLDAMMAGARPPDDVAKAARGFGGAIGGGVDDGLGLEPGAAAVGDDLVLEVAETVVGKVGDGGGLGGDGAVALQLHLAEDAGDVGGGQLGLEGDGAAAAVALGLEDEEVVGHVGGHDAEVGGGIAGTVALKGGTRRPGETQVDVVAAEGRKVGDEAGVEAGGGDDDIDGAVDAVGGDESVGGSADEGVVVVDVGDLVVGMDEGLEIAGAGGEALAAGGEVGGEAGEPFGAAAEALEHGVETGATEGVVLGAAADVAAELAAMQAGLETAAVGEIGVGVGGEGGAVGGRVLVGAGVGGRGGRHAAVGIGVQGRRNPHGRADVVVDVGGGWQQRREDLLAAGAVADDGDPTAGHVQGPVPGGRVHDAAPEVGQQARDGRHARLTKPALGVDEKGGRVMGDGLGGPGGPGGPGGEVPHLHVPHGLVGQPAGMHDLVAQTDVRTQAVVVDQAVIVVGDLAATRVVLGPVRIRRKGGFCGF